MKLEDIVFYKKAEVIEIDTHEGCTTLEGGKIYSDDVALHEPAKKLVEEFLNLKRAEFDDIWGDIKDLHDKIQELTDHANEIKGDCNVIRRILGKEC